MSWYSTLAASQTRLFPKAVGGLGRPATLPRAWPSIRSSQARSKGRGVRWFLVPLGILTGVGAVSYARDERAVVGPWHVHVISSLPLRAVSRLFGSFNSLTLPESLRKPGYHLYAWIFGCNLEEMEDPDLTHYPNLGEFFYRSLKPGARPMDDTSELVSPADGKVLHFGVVTHGQVEQVKGVTYELQALLGGSSNVPQPTGKEDNGDHDQQMAQSSHSANITSEEEFARINGIDYSLDRLIGEEEGHASAYGPRPGNQMYFCVIYLAPGDYHRFHSPVNWIVQTRRHFSGDLFSVSPWMAGLLKDLFVLNERVALLGRWKHGMFSMVPVGATNVGSIVIRFDKDLRTNIKQAYRHGQCTEVRYDQASWLSKGVVVPKGDEMGGFKLGSTVVLIFEAPEQGFTFTLEPGQKVQVGQSLGHFSEESKDD
ncbi:phosphatidylserine decarboxylase-domain-containing protein [Piptocephalis cylindrospora]|uniref:Phosphatidylserine decarboxylase proenzyme 1, mitochondrial n=1 Tax=Piptocephalis cylindrospora TaxID=1907219 RepID=A0A4P9XYM2_9FUNG|nr:phosphatidylserine decarboxylase-domain-containing protein [Piptocephalis cylindrospora]|eukprot:RKP11548.1 phosphatidylserine decarboxylase-domain-containing protein [Piptocephalis cylindrospora]